MLQDTERGAREAAELQKTAKDAVLAPGQAAIAVRDARGSIKVRTLTALEIEAVERAKKEEPNASIK